LKKILDENMISQQLSHTVSIPAEELTALCREYHIKELSIFGSSIHGDAEPESDLDVLVEFFPGHTPGFAFVRLQEELSEAFHRSVDLHTRSSLSRYFRDTIVREAQVVYAAN
jgi:predicted nucleotidyltransferase